MQVYAAGQGLAPHRVVYEISLSDSNKGQARPAALVSLNGRMVYELTGGPCDGYSLSQRLVTSTQMVEGQTVLEDLRSASFQAADGKVFQFITNQLGQRVARKTTRGTAIVADDQTVVAMKEPKSQMLTLPNEVVFPSGYIEQLIAAAVKGETLFSRFLFDGSGPPGEYFQVITSIGYARTSSGDQSSLFPLKTVRYWPVSIGYFDVGACGEDMMPVYEVTTDLYENGISGPMLFDFGDYALRGEVTSLELLPRATCD